MTRKASSPSNRSGASGYGAPLMRRRRRRRLRLPVFLAVLALVALVVLGSGRIRYPRCVARAADRVGELDYTLMDTIEEIPDLHPVFAVAERFELSEGEEKWLREAAADPSRAVTDDGRARLAAIGARHRDVVAEALHLAESSPASLGFDSLATDTATIPGAPRQPWLSRFVYLRAVADLEDGDDPAVLEAIRWLGWHATLHETGSALMNHLTGMYSEVFQLRLIVDMLSRRRTAGELRAMRGALSPHDFRDLYTRALAYELALIRYTIREAREYVSKRRAKKGEEGIPEWIGKMFGDEFAFHMGAGAANWVVVYADAYDLPFQEARALLDYDPDEISFFEGVGLQIGVKAWWMPGRYRGTGEIRRLVAILLEALQDETGDCSDLAERLRPHAELIRLDGAAGGLCRVRYASAEGYRATFDDNAGLDPPLEALVALPVPLESTG